MAGENESNPPPAPKNSGLAKPDQVLPNPLLVIATPGPVLYPTLLAPLVVWHARSIATIEEALLHQSVFGMLLTKEDGITDNPMLSELYSVGIAVRVLKRVKLPDGSIQILVQGIKRFKVKKAIVAGQTAAKTESAEQPHLVVEPEYINDIVPDKTIEIDALTKNIINHVRDLSQTNPFFTDEMKLALVNAPHSGVAADIVSFALALRKTDAQEFLETFDVKERFEKLLIHLRREQDVANLQKKINDEVNNKIQTLQREFFLKEQLKQIKKELGLEEEGKEKTSRTFRERIAEAKMPADIEKITLSELERFETLNEASPEFNISRNYLEALVDLPWSKKTIDNLNIDHARTILDEDHFGLKHVKDRIVEFLAVRKLKSANSANSNHQRGSIILLVGPPGVGKTSVGKSIARSMGRNFYRFSLGGMRDEAEIKGHRRTYIGAMPGKFIQAARRAGSKNAVILLDEVDKISQSYSGDPAAALLEVLDPEQNQNFLDHYLDVPFDLSEMLFICTANTISTIPAPLLDRMEVIELSGYTLEEKEEITKRYLLPHALESAALKPSQLKLSRTTIRTIIRDYAREPGLRTLQQQLEKLARKTAAKIVERHESRERLRFPIEMKPENLREWLGPKRYWNEVAERVTHPGISIGMAWTSTGGDILFIEAVSLVGSGQLKLTGSMGEVMTESANIAWTYVKKRAIEELGVGADYFKNKDFHVHLPAGAIPKDGPSAGVTLATALYSLISGRIVKTKLAMTGELSLTGKVLPVGGIREKLLAAKRSGIQTVLLPEANRKDLEDLPVELLKTLKIHCVDHIDKVFELALEKRHTAKKDSMYSLHFRQ